MIISVYQKKIEALQEDLSSPERLRQRCERLFPGVAVKIEYNKGKASVSGLTPDQLAQLMTP